MIYQVIFPDPAIQTNTEFTQWDDGKTSKEFAIEEMIDFLTLYVKEHITSFTPNTQNDL